jgi:hypothetical protein
MHIEYRALALPSEYATITESRLAMYMQAHHATFNIEEEEGW